MVEGEQLEEILLCIPTNPASGSAVLSESVRKREGLAEQVLEMYTSLFQFLCQATRIVSKSQSVDHFKYTPALLIHSWT